MTCNVSVRYYIPPSVWNNMDDIMQLTFSNAVSGMKIVVLWPCGPFFHHYWSEVKISFRSHPNLTVGDCNMFAHGTTAICDRRVVFSWFLLKAMSGFADFHYCDVIISKIASQITNLTVVYSTVYSDADQIKHQSSTSLAFVLGIGRGPVNSPHKWPVMRKMSPFDYGIMCC